MQTTSRYESPTGYYPCFSKIIFQIYDSFGLWSDRYKQELKFVTNQIVTNNWTNFERIGVQFSGGSAYYFGHFNSFDSFQSILNTTADHGNYPIELPEFVVFSTLNATYVNALGFYIESLSITFFKRHLTTLFCIINTQIQSSNLSFSQWIGNNFITIQISFFKIFRPSDAIVRSIPLAQYINSKLGRLLIVVMGVVVDINLYNQLTSYVVHWNDFDNPPPLMAQQIVNSFVC